eukprot:Nitzschia sp. Nitz4//scaffold289_size23394//9758//10390//NITZ4_008477-RA/size23394-processed-gene-0.12-mRNA-1//-1//CDS//3329545822//2115//frame0
MARITFQSPEKDNETVATVCESPSCSMHSFGGIYDSRNTKVHFDEDSPVWIEEDEPTVFLTEDEVSALWYSTDEYRLIKKSQYFALKLMENKEPFPDDEDLCARGLESRTRNGSRLKRMNIESAWDAVLYEQEKQYNDGRYNTTLLAKIYREATAQCAMTAFLRAKSDSQFVQKAYNLPPFTPTKTSTTSPVLRTAARKLSLETVTRLPC